MHIYMNTIKGGGNGSGEKAREFKRLENADFSSAAIIGVTQSARKQFPLAISDRPIFQAEIKRNGGHGMWGLSGCSFASLPENSGT